jgi:hypothetical protein
VAEQLKRERFDDKTPFFFKKQLWILN